MTEKIENDELESSNYNIIISALLSLLSPYIISLVLIGIDIFFQIENESGIQVGEIVNTAPVTNYQFKIAFPLTMFPS